MKIKTFWCKGQNNQHRTDVRSWKIGRHQLESHIDKKGNNVRTFGCNISFLIKTYFTPWPSGAKE